METLTKTEKQQLRDSGYSAADVSEISSMIKKTSYALVTEKNEKLTISEKEAIKRLGRDEWIRGICRSVFYTETTRYGLNGERLHLYTKNYS